MSTTSSILGVDMGGTKIALALFDAKTLERRALTVLPTGASRGFDFVCNDLLAAIDAIKMPDTIAIGIGVPGLIEAKNGIIRTLPNIPGAEGKDLRFLIQSHTKLPTVIENESRCFAFGEAMLGAGKDHDIVIGITLGTGVGGGVVIHQKIQRGAHGFAGEIGHMLLRPGQPPYKTENKRGDIEQFLSGTAMGKRCAEAQRPDEYLEGAVCEFMRPEIFREVAWLITNLTHAFDPSIIIFGGSAGRALKPHFGAIKKELQNWLLPTVDAPELAISVLDDAGLRGAALLAQSGI
jgi:glucokinase